MKNLMSLLFLICSTLIISSCENNSHELKPEMEKFDPLTYNFVNMDARSVAFREAIINSSKRNNKARFYSNGQGNASYQLIPSGFVYNAGSVTGGSGNMSNNFPFEIYFQVTSQLKLSNFNVSGGTVINSGTYFRTIKVSANTGCNFSYTATFNPGSVEGTLELQLTSPTNVAVNYTDDRVYFIK